MKLDRYKDDVIEFLGEDNLEYLRGLEYDDLVLVWGSYICGAVGAKVRNFLRDKHPEIDTQYKDYGELEDASWELIKKILNREDYE